MRNFNEKTLVKLNLTEGAKERLKNIFHELEHHHQQHKHLPTNDEKRRSKDCLFEEFEELTKDAVDERNHEINDLLNHVISLDQFSEFEKQKILEYCSNIYETSVWEFSEEPEEMEDEYFGD